MRFRAFGLSLGLSMVANFAPALAQNVFSNNTPITIPSSGNAIPYPSTIGVAGLTPPGLITNVVVTLKGVTHPRMSDVDIVLVGPGGQNCELLSDAGGDNAVSGLDLTFSRTGRVFKSGDLLATGTFLPVNLGTTLENFPAPGPGIVSNTDLAVFSGTSAVGTWSLFIIDDNAGPSSTTGSITGWTIRFNDPLVETAQSGSEFSYQGVLKKDGLPFTGAADLRFSLWNDSGSATPGSQFGASIDRPGVAVTNGVFTTLLDFGPGAFSEKKRFLQVESRVAPDTTFTPILPRTPITGTPFAGIAPLAKAANQLDAPDGSPTKIVEVDDFGFAKVNSSLTVSGNLDVGFTLTANGGIVLPATTRLRTYAAAAWRPIQNTLAYSLSNGDWLTGSTASATVTFFLPLDLPDGAVIREVTLFADDQASANNITFSLRRVPHTGTGAVLVATSNTSSLSGIGSVTIGGLSESVAANTAAYTINASWVVPTTTSQIRAGSVRVKYEITSPLP